MAAKVAIFGERSYWGMDYFLVREMIRIVAS